MVELGPYNMAQWASRVTNYKAAGNGAVVDKSLYSLFNSSKRALPTNKQVNLDILVDDILDDVLWNGSSLRS